MVSSNVKYKQFVVNGLKNANAPVWSFNLRKWTLKRQSDVLTEGKMELYSGRGPESERERDGCRTAQKESQIIKTDMIGTDRSMSNEPSLTLTLFDN